MSRRRLVAGTSDGDVLPFIRHCLSSNTEFDVFMLRRSEFSLTGLLSHVKYLLDNMSASTRKWMEWSRFIEDNYGRKRAMMEYHGYLFAYRIGLLREYTNISWARVERIVFVCAGNICRSPYAEVVAATRGLSVVSAGLDARAGVQADPDAIRNADHRGINLSGHVTSRIGDVSIRASDLLVGMEPSQGRKLQLNNKVQTSGAQVTLLGLWGATPSPTITDPYGCSDGYFQACYSRIDSGIAGIVKRIAGRDG